MARSLTLLCCLALLFPLSGCGTQERDRTTGGAATGAATGAAIGLVGGPVGVVLGALIGGGAGATTGAVTPPQDLNLGAPPWSSNTRE
jgi:phage tail tape-measure protein